MASTGNNVAKWLPRFLGILFAAFLAMLAMDAGSIIGLLIHLTPSLVVLVCVLVGWRRPLLGGILFLGLAIVATGFFRTYRDIVNFLMITGPFVLVGVLFLLHWKLSGTTSKSSA